MGLSCGIVGLPNVGKSTLFNALAKAAVAASNYPFCTIEPNVGVVPVPDSRLEKLAKLMKPEKVVPTSVRFVDIAGLVKGSSQGEGMGNQFLSHIAQVDAVVHVVRCFEDSQVAHVTGSIDPKRDVEMVATELCLKDLAVVTAEVSRLQKVAKGGDKKAAATLEILKTLESGLNEGRPARAVADSLSAEDLERLEPYELLTFKPVLYVANVGEKEIVDENSAALQALRKVAESERSPVVPICASLEAQIAQLASEEERSEYLEAVGLKEPGLNRLIRAGYELLKLVTFFTVVGTKETRAWTVRSGATALEAAGKVHTDMARGFIRAEVTGVEELIACGSEAGAREKGKLHQEGKGYVVQDGDVIHFRFSV